MNLQNVAVVYTAMMAMGCIGFFTAIPFDVGGTGAMLLAIMITEVVLVTAVGHRFYARFPLIKQEDIVGGWIFYSVTYLVNGITSGLTSITLLFVLNGIVMMVALLLKNWRNVNRFA